MAQIIFLRFFFFSQHHEEIITVIIKKDFKSDMMKFLRQSVPIFMVTLATPFPDLMIPDLICNEELCCIVLCFYISAMPFE